MAYTYDDFVAAATGAGLMDQFGEDDLKLAKSNPEYGLSALKLTQELKNATTAEQQLLAQEALKQLRTNYGSIGNTGSTGSFVYDNESAYQELLNAVATPGSFRYDAAKDPSYAAMKKTYLREGERAREDTLAKAAAATGGVPSSYAVTAAQQSGDYYAGQLADQLPTLEKNAYQRYLSEQSQKLSGLSALTTDKNFDYNAYLQDYENKQNTFANALSVYKQLGDAAPDWVMDALGIQKQAVTTPTYGGGAAQKVEENTGGIPAAMVSTLKSIYPGGKITSEAYWNSLVGRYGTSALAAAGIYLASGNETAGAGTSGNGANAIGSPGAAGGEGLHKLPVSIRR